jgi:RNA polymerase primary sigma factor
MTSFIPCTEWRRVLPQSSGADRTAENQKAHGANRTRRARRPQMKARRTGSGASLDGRLSSEDVGTLVRRTQAGDPDARDTLIQANSRLVAKIARRYAPCSSLLADLMQAGYCGLIRAAERYDPTTQDAPFSSYAALWIMKTIQRTVADNFSLVRMPHRLFWLQGRYRKVIDELITAAEGNPRDLNPDEVASRMQISPRQLSSLVRAMIRKEPLSAQGDHGEERLLEETIPDPHRPDLEVEQAEEVALLYAALDRLVPFEAWVIRCRFGLDDPTGWGLEARSDPARSPTCEEIGRFVGITAMRVREIEQAALHKLREHLTPLLAFDEASR